MCINVLNTVPGKSTQYIFIIFIVSVDAKWNSTRKSTASQYFVIWQISDYAYKER